MKVFWLIVDFLRKQGVKVVDRLIHELEMLDNQLGRIFELLREEKEQREVDSYYAKKGREAEERELNSAQNVTVNFDGGLVGDPERQASQITKFFDHNKITHGNLTMNVKSASVEKVDTRKNHLKQKRGPDGRFLKKEGN